MEISSDTILKLGHNIIEIRLRTLDAINEKVQNALSIDQFTNANFNVPLLMKWLIRWFGQYPLCRETMVLELIFNILKSSEAHRVISTLGYENLLKKMKKIENIVQSSNDKKMANNITDLLDNMKDIQNVETSSVCDSGTLTTDNNLASEMDTSQFHAMYEPSWHLTEFVDKNELKKLNDSFNVELDDSSLFYSLQYLCGAVDDFPPECFLQPPYIFEILNKLFYTKASYCEQLLKIFLRLTKSLRKRLKIRISTKANAEKCESSTRSTNQISVAFYCLKLFKIVTHEMKSLCDETNSKTLYKSCKLFSLLVDLINTGYVGNFHYDNILNEFAYCASFFRQSQKDGLFAYSMRNYYITTVYFISSAALSGAKLSGSDDLSNCSDERQMSELSMKTKEMCLWIYELIIATYDYPLKETHAIIYDLVFEALKLTFYYNFSNLMVLSKSSDNILSALDLLRNSNDFESILAKGLLALDCLSLLKSDDLTKLIMKTALDSFDGNNINAKLKQNSVEITLRLLAHENVEIKRICYEIYCDKIKYIAGKLLNLNTARHTFSANSSIAFPLTKNILLEIACFGYYNDDPKVHSYAEIILAIILRSFNIISEHFVNLMEIYRIVLPLLQCYASRQNDVGMSLLNLIYAYKKLSKLEQLQSCVRLLFNTDYTIRTDAVSNLTLLLSSSIADSSVLKINNIIDTIPNNICILNEAIDPQRIFANNIYEVSTVIPLLELLEQDNVEPTLIKATLIQLNVMAQDIEVLHTLNNHKVLLLLFDVLENSLNENEYFYYPDCSVSVVGIIAKMCLFSSSVCKKLCTKENVFVLILTSLMLYHSNSIHKTNCVVTVFLLAYGDYLIESNGNIMLPRICSKMCLPLKCQFYWNENPFSTKSQLEKCLWEQTDSTTLAKTDYNSEYNIQKMQFNASWQYFRVHFATLWCNNFENLALKCKNGNFYRMENGRELTLNTQIILTSNDISLIHISFPQNGIKHWLTFIQNATNYTRLVMALSQIQIYFLLPGQFEINTEDILKTLHKFIIVLPQNSYEMIALEHILNLFSALIERDYSDIYLWLLEKLSEFHFVCVDILNKKNISINLYEQNCKLLEMVALKLLPFVSNQDVGRTEEISAISECLFKNIIGALDSYVETKDLDKLRCLTKLLCTISSVLRSTHEEYAHHAIERIFYLLFAIRSFGEIGSNINKNCLFSIGNILYHSFKTQLSGRHLKLLSGLCGHVDVEVRMPSWGILQSLAMDVENASQIIKELAFLPGGFHACCLSTFLDTNESPVVRSVAGYLFSNLVSFLVDDNTNIMDVSVKPVTINKELSDYTELSSEEIIFQIIHQQYFFNKILRCFKSVNNETNEQYTSAEFCEHHILGALCSILLNIINLNNEIMDQIVNSGIILQIIRLIPTILNDENQSTYRTFTDICKFLQQCFSYDLQIAIQITSQEGEFIRTMIKVLDPFYFQKYGKNLKNEALKNVLSVMKYVVTTTFGMQALQEGLNGSRLSSFLGLLIYCIEYKNDVELNIITLELLTKIIVYENDECNFAFLLDVTEVFINNDEEIAEQFFAFGERDCHLSCFASELLFSSLYELFKQFKAKDILWLSICKTIGLLLKVSLKVRCLATTKQFLSSISQESQNILDNMKMEPSDFIRRFGDTKKYHVLRQFKALYEIILNWYSVDSLIDSTTILQFCQISQKLWKWSNVNVDFQIVFLNTLVFLSEDSIFVCRTYSTYRSENYKTILQLLTELVISKTTSPKISPHDVQIVQISIRVVSNCCACTEGRLFLSKVNMLDALDRLNPSMIKQHKVYNMITVHLVEFYEVFTRYPDFSSVNYLPMLCGFIRRSTSSLRTLSLKTLRNMAYGHNNKAALINSDEYLHTLKSVIETGSTDEKLIVISAIWNLVANSYKNKHKVKCSQLYEKLLTMESITLKENFSSEITFVFEILKYILQK